MPAKKIVVLANSIKHKKRCVAGKCLATGQWIRPVADTTGEALSFDQLKCRNPHGIFAVKTLQKVTIEFITAKPLIHQPENYLIAANEIWQQDFKIHQQDLPRFLDNPISIWGGDSRVSYQAICQNLYKPHQSLFLVQTQGLQLYYAADKKRRVSFKYNGIAYDLPATDPQFDTIFREKRKLMGILCISLGEEHHGYCYKIAAAIY